MEPPSVVRGKPPSILASNGLSLMGTTASMQQVNPYDVAGKQVKQTVARTNSAAKKSEPGATDRSFYPTPSANQPFDLSLEDFLSPQHLNVQNIKMKPALDNETEMGLIDTAMRDHGQMMTLLR